MNITSKECYHQLARDLKICRIVNGMWQVAGGHGYIDYELAIEDMITPNIGNIRYYVYTITMYVVIN